MEFSYKFVAACLVTLGVTMLLTSTAAAGGFTEIGTIGPFAGGGPRSVAVESSTGDIYVLNNGEEKIEEFEAGGKPTGKSFNGGETPSTSFSGLVVGLAVDNSPSSPSKGDVYVADRSNHVVDKFETSGKGKYAGELTGFEEPTGVAVDSNGDVYVTDVAAKVVREFTPEGKVIAEIAGPDMTAPFGVAVGANGVVYIVNSAENIVKVKLNGNHEVEAETIIDAEEEPTAVAIEPVTGDIFVVSSPNEESHVVVLSASGKKEAEFGAGQIAFSRGIAFSSFNGDVYVADKNKNLVDIYGGSVPPPPPPLPAPVTGSVSAVERTSGTFNGTVNPEGGEAKFYFEYGPCTTPSTCAGGAFSSKTTEGVVGTGKEVTPVPVEERLTNELTPGTTYHMRLVASNEGGSAAGEEVVFATPPAVAGVSQCVGRETGLGTLVGGVLEGSLEPDGEEAEYYFEYGITTSYAGPPTEFHRTTSSGVMLANAKVTELEPNAMYNCRLTATRRIEGVLYAAHGENGTFTTRAVLPAVNDRPPSASEIGRSSAVLNGTINPEHNTTTYRFVYVEAARYEPTVKNRYYAGGSTPEASAGEAFADEVVESPQITGLRAGTTYDYALEATNEVGTEVGPNYEFTTAPGTPPVVGAGSASAITQASAMIADAIDPKGLPTTYELDLGADPSYSGAKIFGQVVEGYETIAVRLEDLAPGTTYYYRILATNEDGTTEGPGQMFTTPGVASPITAPLAPPLLATPPIVFPTEPGKVIKPPPKEKSGKSKKKHRVKSKSKSKSKGRRKVKGKARRKR